MGRKQIVTRGGAKPAVLWIGSSAVCFALGFVTAMPPRNSAIAAAPPEAAPEAPAPAAAAPEGKAKRRKVERPFLVRPAESCPAADSSTERDYRVQQSRELMGLLRSKIRSTEATNPIDGPEGVMNGLAPYLIGWTDALVRTAPDMVDELAAEFEASLCNPDLNPSEVMVISRVMGQMPELGNDRGFDCIFERGAEDMVLWSTLDAWRANAMPKSAAFAKLEQSARDERTRSRLVKLNDADFSALAEPETETVDLATVLKPLKQRPDDEGAAEQVPATGEPSEAPVAEVVNP
jgi:hypothetical protein